MPLVVAGEFTFSEFVTALPIFTEGALGQGHANQPIGPGNKVRHLPLTVAGGEGTRFPALAVAGVMAHLRQSPMSPLTSANGFIKVLPSGLSRDVPVNDVRQLRINYVGGTAAMPRISYVDAINNDFDPADVEGKLVFVGLTATGLGDMKSTPLAEEMPGVEVHANAADTMLRSRFLPDPEPMMTFAIMMEVTVILSLTVPFWSLLWSSLLGVLIVVGYVIVAAFLTQMGLLLEISYPVVLIALMAVTMMLYRNLAERAQLTGLFGTYVGKGPVAAAILEQSDTWALGLGGDRASLSLLFTDIRGFSTFSEQMEPHALVDLLNEYLTEMTDLVFDEDGVLDEYIGDAVMAFWGWPLKQDDHAVRAMKTSIRMVETLAVMSEDFEKRGLPGLGIRTGVNSGDAAVGNMGSKSRFSIMAMGDNVNLAARPEPINDQYGTDQMISGDTLEMVDGDSDEFLTRPIDIVAVKGRTLGTHIHELIGFNDGKHFTDHIAPWNEAIDLYRGMKFREAIMAFEKVLQIRPDDGPTKLYLERCAAMAEDPPEGAWDGVLVMKSKG
ncbi:MAG: adenylate/guanylate cyclase domain-containing protein [Chloroflexota bacterium]|nr:adenylate/guanylate cyclase domain-containing protein [Chloroflexota bacterium]MDP6758338.1 adenylate/guanylate cyclase domain-containing protein [Chloroflexota bacterium]